MRELPDVDFADLVRMLAEGIADAQVSLDRASASMVEELAAKEVSLVPEIREVVDGKGNVSYEQAPPRPVSLLELGITPTFYQFSQATVEVSMDIKIVEEERATSGKPKVGLVAGTATLQAERRLNREVTGHSKLTATMVPVPMPARVEPARTVASET